MTVDTGRETGPGSTWRPPAGIGTGLAVGDGERGIELPADLLRPALSLPVWWDEEANAQVPAPSSAPSFEKPAPPPAPTAPPTAQMAPAPAEPARARPAVAPVPPTDADLGPAPAAVRQAAAPAPVAPVPVPVDPLPAPPAGPLTADPFPADPLPGAYPGPAAAPGTGGVDGTDGEADFGWSFEPDPDFVWEDEAKPSPPWWRHPVALLSAAVVFVGVAGAYIMLGGEEEQPPPPPPTTAPQPATPIAPEELAAHQARSVAVKTAEGRLQVTWRAPDLPEDVVGYAVVAQTPAGELLDRKLVDPDELVVVFTDRAALPGTCAVVTTLVRAAPSLMLAKGNAVCLPSASGSPAPGAESAPPPTGTPAPDAGADAPDDPAAVPPEQ